MSGRHVSVGKLLLTTDGCEWRIFFSPGGNLKFQLQQSLVFSSLWGESTEKRLPVSVAASVSANSSLKGAKLWSLLENATRSGSQRGEHDRGRLRNPQETLLNSAAPRRPAHISINPLTLSRYSVSWLQPDEEKGAAFLFNDHCRAGSNRAGTLVLLRLSASCLFFQWKPKIFSKSVSHEWKYGDWLTRDSGAVHILLPTLLFYFVFIGIFWNLATKVEKS